MKKSAYILLCSVALCLCSCSPKLVIVHTNDTHSHHEALRSGENMGRGGIIERGALVDSIVNANSRENVLLLHAGDFNQGSSYYTRLKGSLEVDVVNTFGYDCITLGNHEFDNGLDDLCERVKKIQCPLVCANVDFGDHELSKHIKPYTIVEKAGRKIGIIGLAPDISKVVMASVAKSVTQCKDNAPVVNGLALQLRKKEKCDLVILLTHIGFDEDCLLVPQIRNVDVVIGGHSHTFIDDIQWSKDADGKKVPIVTDGCWGLNLGELTIR